MVATYERGMVLSNDQEVERTPENLRFLLAAADQDYAWAKGLVAEYA